MSLDTRVAIIAVVVEDPDSTEALNQLLHDYAEYIIGRMGVPYQKKQVSLISIMVDAPQKVVSALAGKLGMLPGVSAKTLYAKV
jgi:putative iron-only hydrogenase system regulator